jgi:hypothetical protein
MSVYESGETYVNVTTVREPTQPHSVVTDSTVSLSILDECGAYLLTDAEMSYSTALEGNTYNFNLPAGLRYGKYTTVVTVTDGADTVINRSAFFVLPHDLIQQTRALSGISEEKSISDDDLAQIIIYAMKEVEAQCYVHQVSEVLCCSCSYMFRSICCTSSPNFDGTETTFYTANKLLADYNHDGEVTGYGETSCGTDVFFTWQDASQDIHTGHVTVLDAEYGKIEITQNDGTTPIPSDMLWGKLEYWTHAPCYTESLFVEAAIYLACHKLLLRFKELTRATVADLDKAQNRGYSNPQRMLKEYKRVLRKIRSPIVGGAVLNP